MDKWFTTERIDQDTYIISEYRHWEETHCYLLYGTNRSLLIDTGLGISNIYEEVRRLTDNPVTAVATHVHWDHIGGHKYFPDFYVHSLEAEWLNGKFPLPVEAVRKMVFPFRPELRTCCAAAGEHDSGGSLGFAKRICMPKLLVTGHGVNSNIGRRIRQKSEIQVLTGRRFAFMISPIITNFGRRRQNYEA